MNLIARAHAIEELEAFLLEKPQVDCPLVHRFAPGVYLREILMAIPAGEKFLFVIGQKHKTEHFNIVLKGRCRVAQIQEDGSIVDGTVEEIVAPCTFISGPGVRKALFVTEDTIWQTVHVTPETDMVKLRDLLIEESSSFRRHQVESLQCALSIQ